MRYRLTADCLGCHAGDVLLQTPKGAYLITPVVLLPAVLGALFCGACHFYTLARL